MRLLLVVANHLIIVKHMFSKIASNAVEKDSPLLVCSWAWRTRFCFRVIGF